MQHKKQKLILSIIKYSKKNLLPIIMSIPERARNFSNSKKKNDNHFTMNYFLCFVSFFRYA